MKKIFFIPVLIFLFGFSFCAFAQNIGERQKFYIEKTYDLFKREEMYAVLIKETAKIHFYVDENWWSSASKDAIYQNLDNLREEFEYKIYPVLVSTFGPEWNPGVDKDSKLTVLIHPMIEQAGGYFNSRDEYYKVQDTRSNEREMVYLNSSYLGTSYDKSFLAHEFLHLITFNQKENSFGVSEDVWLNEARAEYVSTLLGYDEVYKGSNLEKKVQIFSDFSQDSLIDWKSVKYDYGSINLFVHYLVDNYGKNILIDSLQSKKTGIDSLEYALAKNGFKEDFSQLFLNWTIANYINDCNFGNNFCYKNANLSNFHITPQINFLPLAGKSVLAFSDNLANWSANWYKIIGGKGTLNVKFEGNQAFFGKVAYITGTNNSNYKVNYLVPNKLNSAEVSIENFGNSPNLFVIIPSLYSKNLPAGSSLPFSWSVSVSKPEDNNNSGEDPALISQLLAKIEFLKKEIAKFQALLDALLKNKNTSCVRIENDLYFGLKNNEVLCLQKFLKFQGMDIYPEGLVTGFFGEKTKAAVIKFQEKYKIFQQGFTKGSGVVDKATKDKINLILSQIAI